MNITILPRLVVIVLLLLLSGSLTAQTVLDDPALTFLSRYETGLFDEGAAESVAYDPGTQRLFFTNADENSVVILDASNPYALNQIVSIDLSPYGDGVNSVAVYDGVVAVAVQADPTQDPGSVVLFDTDGNYIADYTVGALPDMLTFTPDGTHILVANEGEPNDDYTVDPEGSVSIIDLTPGLTTATVSTVGFTDFNAGESRADELPTDVRIFGPNATVAQDLEPEYITVSNETAYVGLQENNALAVIDIASETVVEIFALGFKDHAIAGQGIDASNEDDGINIQNWPVSGMYQPDAISSFQASGQTYIVTANEGDARDYDGFSEEVRVGDLNVDFGDPSLVDDENLGRLRVTNTLGNTGDLDEDGEGGNFVELFSYGARSFSIWMPDGTLVYDSGEEFEQITAAALPEDFNSNNDENDSFDSRSDDKGPEPEALAIGVVDDRTYAIIGLERVSGLMVYDITDPTAPFFVQYLSTRNFDVDLESELSLAGDVGPEVLTFIPADLSPISLPLVVAANEISGTIAVHAFGTLSQRVAALLAEVDALGGLNGGQKRALSAKLESALKKLNRGRTNGVAGPLGAFLNQVEAFSKNGRLPGESGPLLAHGVQEVLDLLESGTPESAIAASRASVEFSLANYPEPFNPSTTITYALAEDAEVQLDVFDVTGRRVAVLVQGFQQAGAHQAVFQASSLPSGLYLYRLQAGEHTVTRRMLLLK